MKKMQSSDLMEGLTKGLKADADGNVIVGKDLEVDGKTKLNGGFEPIHFYQLQDRNGIQCFIAVYFETYVPADNSYCFTGDIRNSKSVDGVGQIISGYYIVDGDTITSLVAMGADPASHGNSYIYYDRDDGDIFTKKEEQIKKYYQHRLVVSGGSRTKHALLTWVSIRGMAADSVQDLRTILDPASGAFPAFDYGNDDPSTHSEAVPFNVCAVVISASVAKIIDIDLNETNITTVSDVVTPL